MTSTTFVLGVYGGGDSHSCALNATNDVFCWGAEVDAELGNGATGASSIPDDIDYTGITGEEFFIQIDVGEKRGCGITAEGEAYCWGDDTNGELGDSATSSNQDKPTAVDTSAL